jgi:hypothetical protein
MSGYPAVYNPVVANPNDGENITLCKILDAISSVKDSIELDSSRFSFSSNNRVKVSPYESIFFNTFQYGKETDVWDESTANGGSAVHNPNVSGVTLSVTNTLNSEVVRQTIHTMRYIPSRTSTLTFSVKLNPPTSGIRRRFGLNNGIDGFYFEDDGSGDYFCCIANSTGTPALQRVGRANWNGDKLDGNGPSGIVADPTKQQIVSFDYEWYGAGQVKFGFVINGQTHIIHTFNTANELVNPWCRTPFLPIRIEIKNTTGGQAAGTYTISQGSNSLISEGESEKLGVAQNIQTAITGITTGSANTYTHLLSLRLKASALQGVVLPAYFQVATLDNTSVFYKLVRNATITGGTWVDMPDPNSFTQYNITATGFSDGINLDSGFVIPGSGNKIAIDKNTQFQIGRSSMGTVSNTISIVVASAANNKEAVAEMTWIEQR